MLRFNNLTYRIGARILLDEAEATISPGHRVGMVGRNGAGKTTLLRLITGELSVAGGSIDCPKRWRIGVTAQEAPSGATSLLDTVLNADTELANLVKEAETATDPARIAAIHERLRDRDSHTATARAARILAGLGFDEAAQNRPCNDFSGGWRMRVALAALLFTEPDLLLLDEPTNHLDVESRQALVQAINAFSGAVVIVSHDPHVIELTADRFWLVDKGAVTTFEGDMADYRSFLLGRSRDTDKGPLEASPVDRKQQRREAAALRKVLAPLRIKASKAEAHVAHLESEKARLEAAMADPTLYDDKNGKLVSLQKQLGQLEKELSQAEEDWIQLQEDWEQAQNGEAGQSAPFANSDQSDQREPIAKSA